MINFFKNLWRAIFGPKPEVNRGVSPHEPVVKAPADVAKEPPWITIAKSMIGQKETDTKFAASMVPFWKKLFGRSLKAIAGNSNAWCGLFVARCLYDAGLSWQKNGELAGNWRSYGVSIDWQKVGIPKGAIIHINHNGNCKIGSSGNHVTFAATDHSAHDLTERVSTFYGLGGNQSNRVSIAAYSTKEICEVRWPKEYPIPAPVTKSKPVSAESAGSTQ